MLHSLCPKALTDKYVYCSVLCSKALTDKYMYCSVLCPKALTDKYTDCSVLCPKALTDKYMDCSVLCPKATMILVPCYQVIMMYSSCALSKGYHGFFFVFIGACLCYVSSRYLCMLVLFLYFVPRLVWISNLCALPQVLFL